MRTARLKSNAIVVILVLTGIVCGVAIWSSFTYTEVEKSAWNFKRIFLSHYVTKNFIKSNINIRNITEIDDRIIEIAQTLRVAQLHARGEKTTLALKNAEELMDSVLKDYGTSYNKVSRRKVFTSKSICPEYFVDPLYGFPQYEVGYEIEKCSYASPIEKLVTVIMVIHGSNWKQLEHVMTGLRLYQNNIPVVIGIHMNSKSSFADGNAEIIQIPKDASEGDALNTLIPRVRTEYTLIARDVIDFNHDARIDRLVREIERLNVSVVGGSIRNSDSIWNMACHQRAFQNSIVVYKEGYDESLHDCVFCDHIDGPYLIRTDKLNGLMFDGTITPMGLYEDFFMRIENEVAVCPDSLFYVDFPKRRKETTSWESFRKKRNLYKLTFSSGPAIEFGCSYSYPCELEKGYVRSPCCIKELADTNNDAMKMCEASGIICEFQAGTLLGAVKLGQTIPWEIDGDIRVWYENFTILGKAGEMLQEKGYSFVKHASVGGCNTTSKVMLSNGYYYVNSKHWFVEMYTYCGMDSYDLMSKQLNRTKVLHNGYAAYATRNPPLVVRNMYPQYLGHVQHFREDGVWNIHRFSKCKEENRHDCIDRYYEDGNLQFDGPIP